MKIYIKKAALSPDKKVNTSMPLKSKKIKTKLIFF